MLRKMFMISSIMIFSLMIVGVAKSGPNYVIDVRTPTENQEVPMEFRAEGKVTIWERKKILDDMCLVPLIKPATYPRYYIQSEKCKLEFRDVNGGFESEWSLLCKAGERIDYGKKFYVHFFLTSRKSLRYLEDLAKKSKRKGINAVLFEKLFLNRSDKYFGEPVRIPIIREFPALK